MNAFKGISTWSGLIRYINNAGYMLEDFGPKWSSVTWIKARMPNGQLVRYSWEPRA